VVGAGGVDSVFVGDDLPELGSDLVAALAALDVHDFSHVFKYEISYENRFNFQI